MRVNSLIVPAGAAVTIAAVALALASHGNAASATRSPAAVAGKRAPVTIKNYAFAPQSLTVKVGTRLEWINRDSTAHTATADQGSLDTGTVNPGQSKTINFTHPGTYAYHCAFHAFMNGTITVVR